MFYREEEFENMLQAVVLLDYSPGYRLGDFDCEVQDYNDFLVNDAPYYIEQNICQVKILLEMKTGNVIAYMTLNADSFILDQAEKEREHIEVPYKSIPALKIGKLAVDKRYRDKPYGSFMLWLAMAHLEQMNEVGIGGRFLVVDADITNNPKTPEFYEKNGFVYNEKVNERERTDSLSMRLDIFQDN